MSSTDQYQKALERAFESTLVEEIIPGILHNFANPLNGIMGRSKLLQRKLETNAGAIADPAASPDIYGKLIRDVELIGRDTDKLSALLKHVAEKFYMISRTSGQRVNLSEIIGVEMSFFDFYLDFKHNIRKNVQLGYDLPDVAGVPSEFSLALWGLLRQTMLRLGSCNPKEVCELNISTDYVDGQVRVCMANTGIGISHGDWSSIVELLEKDSLEGVDGHSDALLLQALALLKKYRAQFRFESGDGFYRLTVSIPVA